MHEADPRDAIRLDAARAFDLLGATQVGFDDEAVAGPHRITAAAFAATIGDVALARRDMGTSYHLAVVVDDSAQGITVVTRGEDLFESTFIHAVLQGLLKLPQPLYHHHRLIRDERGKRLAKRDDAQALSLYRAQGAGPDDIRQLVAD